MSSIVNGVVRVWRLVRFECLAQVILMFILKTQCLHITRMCIFRAHSRYNTLLTAQYLVSNQWSLLCARDMDRLMAAQWSLLQSNWVVSYRWFGYRYFMQFGTYISYLFAYTYTYKTFYNNLVNLENSVSKLTVIHR